MICDESISLPITVMYVNVLDLQNKKGAWWHCTMVMEHTVNEVQYITPMWTPYPN